MQYDRHDYRSPMALVEAFHEAFRLPNRYTPTTDIAPVEKELRRNLIEEEAAEFREASETDDLIGIADALADLTYVIYGTALYYGIDLDAVLEEVHRSNMTKLGPDGQPMYRADGKVVKGPAYEDPDVAKIIGNGGDRAQS